jgi:ATP-dependent DNA helicase RecQ
MIEGSDGDLAHRRVLSAQLDAMLALCETVECRRVRLLAHFGQQSEPCGNCDTCLVPPESWDATVPAQMLLSTVLRLQRERGQSFGAGQSIDILLGKRTEKVTANSHDELTVFGIGTDLAEGQWRGVVRQLLAQGLLAVSPDGYGTLLLTDAAAEVLSGGRAVRLRREPDRPARAARSRGGSGASGRGASRGAAELTGDDAALFETLREWRAGVARAQGVPAYVVFGDVTLRGIASERPASLDQLAGMSGVGQKKLDTYGQQVLAVVGGTAPAEAAAVGSSPTASAPAGTTPRSSRATSTAPARGARRAAPPAVDEVPEVPADDLYDVPADAPYDPYDDAPPPPDDWR